MLPTEPKNEYPMVSFRTDEKLTQHIENRAPEGESTHVTARRDLERYYSLLERERRVLAGVFSLNELIALCDAANGTMFEAQSMHYYPIEIKDYVDDGGAARFDVDGARLLDTVRGLSAGATWALVDSIERWWKLRADSDAAGFMSVGLVPSEGK